MSEPMKRTAATFLVTVLGLFQATAVWARSDETIQREIEAQLAESKKLEGTRIDVRVERRLVVLTGEVRIYEQKLTSERIAWTTLGVFEVDNQIRVTPRVQLSDIAIERKIREVIKNNTRFRAAGISVAVNKGQVVLKGSFLGFSDPSKLKHKVAEIEGVVSIVMDAVFLAQSRETDGGSQRTSDQRPVADTVAAVAGERHPDRVVAHVVRGIA